MSQISAKQYKQFLQSRATDGWGVGGIRTGQAFCNEFNITDSELFYCKDNKKALELIQKYLHD